VEKYQIDGYGGDAIVPVYRFAKKYVDRKGDEYSYPGDLEGEVP